MHRIAAVCLDGVVAFDLAVPAQVFTLPHRRGEPLYAFEACAAEGSRKTTTSRLLARGPRRTGGDRAGGHGGRAGLLGGHEPLPEELAAALRRVVARGGRVASICTGAFALAHAGLLEGRRATTHWAAAPELARRFPSIEVDPAALYVDEGQVLTSAGLSAGIDLCLHLVRRDHGESMGAAVARAMVAAPHREGGQAQYIDRPLPARDGSLAATRRWALDRLEQPLDAAALARHAGVSTRTFARRFRAETGATPLQWLLSQRVLEARRLLERTDLPVEEVAAAAGFGTAASLREHFRRATATTPTAYRRSFRQPLAA